MRSLNGFNEQPVSSLYEFSGFPEVVEWERRFLPTVDIAIEKLSERE